MVQIGDDEDQDRSGLNTILETITNLEALDVRMKEASREHEQLQPANKSLVFPHDKLHPPQH